MDVEEIDRKKLCPDHKQQEENLRALELETVQESRDQEGKRGGREQKSSIVEETRGIQEEHKEQMKMMADKLQKQTEQRNRRKERQAMRDRIGELTREVREGLLKGNERTVGDAGQKRGGEGRKRYLMKSKSFR
ncbi:hypothetical protein GLAREA_11128 [Glarea lozoyensis ATCC 20868]|uniref:Uncharacterized protein n=1 Tax=Glarea lozoyensis (strain ATCC 20868 / MF5171) TaxID=1116229 RepID=S3DE97_GLAL2|nr:uncharacterized protein GLAREA_11128 [Glarea lozoyensis ATCC 20868]EPE35429.1 hypothetical protein GLAREA_11128 [Glarea lozoyensis ATCC 20868]